MIDVAELERKAKWLRLEILEMCGAAGTGHVSSALSCVEIVVALYYGGILRIDSANPDWDERDRFIISKGHCGIAVYPILADLGFFPTLEIERFAQKGGILGVHIGRNIPGIELTAGSLGHGLGIATGLALSAKMDNKLFMTVALLGDGELYEGSVWEAAMLASHHRLNNLVAIVDRNMLCTIDFTENFLRLNPLDKKWQAFGWDVATIDGHSFGEIMASLKDFRSRRANAPLVIIANTVKGKGLSFMENVPLWHSIAPTGKWLEWGRKELHTATKRKGRH